MIDPMEMNKVPCKHIKDIAYQYIKISIQSQNQITMRGTLRACSVIYRVHNVWIQALKELS